MLLAFWGQGISQDQGDTIFVQTFDYSSSTRDTNIVFPDNGLTYEKIIMSYNMRCKGAQVSTGSNTNLGCGEWDYSCNTYIVDSSKIEEVSTFHPEYTISQFDGDEFSYTTQQTYTYWQYALEQTELDVVISEAEFIVGNGTMILEDHIDLKQNSGKTILLYTKEELEAAGLTAGPIDGIKLYNEGDEAEAQFMKLKVKSTLETELDPASVDMSDFTTVVNEHYNFIKEENRLLFNAPYDWDGLSNLLFELSFTNSAPGINGLQLVGSETTNRSSLYNHNNYSLNLGEGTIVAMNTEGISNIDQEITIAFWTYGDENLLPKNTMLFYGYDTNPNQREINIHLPWSNSAVFFDCGADGGSYDRISKTYDQEDYSGKWNHWAFTKNVATGTLSIYLNGQFSTSNTGNTREIDIENLVMGSGHNGNNSYPGKIRELSIWKKSLNESEISDWINVPLDSTHPQYEHLVAYYPMSEGNSDEIKDQINQYKSVGKNLNWSYERGDMLNSHFVSSQYRPNVSFLRGEYDFEVTEIFSIDSVKNTPSVVQKYYVQSNAGELKHDEVILESSSQYFLATDEILYDAATGDIIGETPVDVEGTIVISDLEYIRRFPFYNEIMSFVTPYGINLDLGGAGKTWYFDVTDYAPILKGEKGIKMTLGGQWQEEMDISFWFIVGTPPRDVVEFNQIWQGTNRIGAARILDIVDDKKITPQDVSISEDAQFFKLRSVITGHGSDGEFEQNGGEVFHFINVDGGFEENYWDVNQECSENPIYPQGGTWVYDRQGWCPGEASYLEELDLTEFLVPGTIANIDYGCSSPNNSSGDYRYHMSHQLISYGAINHELDAAIVDVISPSDKAIHSRINPSCTGATIEVENTGFQDIEELVIEYWINDETKKESFTWTGNLDFGESQIIQLSDGDLWNSEVSGSSNFYAKIVTVNGSSDEYPYNNEYKSTYTPVKEFDQEFIIEIKTNSEASDNKYDFFKGEGELIFTNGLPGFNTVYRDTFNSVGCHNLIIQDFGDDGLAWWANPAQGTGYARIKNINGGILEPFEADFGGIYQYNFRTTGIINTGEFALENAFEIVPNPNSGTFNIQGPDLAKSEVKMFDLSGKEISFSANIHHDELLIQVNKLEKGIYIVQLIQDSGTVSKRVVVQ